MSDESPGDFISTGPAAERLVAKADPCEIGRVVLCSDGHVHIVVGDKEMALSPDDAESWVEVLYDAAQQAREVSDE